MADMNDMKNRLKSMLAVNEEKTVVAAEKSGHIVCVFCLNSFDNIEAVGKASRKNFLVLLNVTTRDEKYARRVYGFMKRVACPMQARIQEVGENVLIYSPDGYQIQGFRN